MKRLICGPRAVTEALRANARELSVVYVSGDPRRELREVAQLAGERKVAVEERSAAELDALAKGERHQGVLAVGGSYSYLSFDELLERLPPAASAGSPP